MSRRRFFVPPDSIGDSAVVLPAEQAHHLRDVLRLRAGDAVEVFDGAGHGYSGVLAFSGSDAVVRGLQPLPAENKAPGLTLAAALIKPSRFEWMLEKATELGVDEILPLKTHHCDFRITDSGVIGRLNRWDRIVKEASKQCRRLASPRILAPIAFDAFLRSEAHAARRCCLFCEKEAELWNPVAEILSGDVVLCIGPEGGWAEDEVLDARNSGCRICGLGDRILRAETAALAAVAVLQHQRLLAAGCAPRPEAEAPPL